MKEHAFDILQFGTVAGLWVGMIVTLNLIPHGKRQLRLCEYASWLGVIAAAIYVISPYRAIPREWPVLGHLDAIAALVCIVFFTMTAALSRNERLSLTKTEAATT